MPPLVRQTGLTMSAAGRRRSSVCPPVVLFYAANGRTWHRYQPRMALLFTNAASKSIVVRWLA